MERGRGIALALLFLAAASTATPDAIAQEPLEAHPDYVAAIRALDEGQAGLAAKQLKDLSLSGDLEGEALRECRTRLLEAYVRSGQAADALEIIAEENIESGAGVDFWNAQALARVGRRSEAEPILSRLSRDGDFRYRTEAILLLSQILEQDEKYAAALETLSLLDAAPIESRDSNLGILRAAEIYYRRGRFREAQDHLRSLGNPSPSISGRATLLRGRMLLSEQAWKDAEEVFAPLLDLPAGDDERLHPAAYLGLVDCYIGGAEVQKAERSIKMFLEKYPASQLLGAAFQRLDELGVFSRALQDPAFESWSASPQPELRAVATYYLAINRARAGDNESARRAIEKFLSEFPEHGLRVEGLLRSVEFSLEDGELEKIADLLMQVRGANPSPEVLAYLSYLEGRALFVAGDFDAAIEKFSKLKRHIGDPLLPRMATFNTALVALALEDEDMFTSEANSISINYREEAYAGLLLDRALYFASQAKAEAGSLLLEFVKMFPRHSGVARAHIALAEIYFLAFPPKPVSAREHLDLARGFPLSEEQLEDLDYISVWIAVSAADGNHAVAMGRKFVERWRDSPRLPEMRMKLGEIYFDQEDYGNAANQWELIAEETPETPLAEIALFSAGKAARLTMQPGSLDRAIDIWGHVVDMDGELILEAREQQGLAKMDLGKEAEAATVFDSILENDPPPAGDLLFSVLCSKGQALFIMADDRPEAMNEAIATFDAVLANERSSRFWRNQAGVRKAKCLEMQGAKSEALEIYTGIARAGTVEPGGELPEYRWYYRAGFEAVRLLEARGEHVKAVRMAELLASSGGNRDQQAAAIANRLRLERFIYREREK